MAEPVFVFSDQALKPDLIFTAANGKEMMRITYDGELVIAEGVASAEAVAELHRVWRQCIFGEAPTP